jgi:methylthioribose-1-phosphate isomerase
MTPNAAAVDPATIDFDRYDRVRPLRWTGEALEVLDQRRLPFVRETVVCRDAGMVAEAIHALAVRGAPAIGIAAAWGVVLAARDVQASDGEAACAALDPALRRLAAARPTAVNLAWALARLTDGLRVRGAEWRAWLAQEAQAIADEDLAANRRMGLLGAACIAPGSGVLTHCNTGSLATAGFGTALGVIRAGVASGRIDHVYASETRPWLQGARLTAWELHEDGIAPTLIADAASAHLMHGGYVQWLIVGADRICANGDTANKIGTLMHMVNARHFGVRTMVVAPASTVDMAMPDGSAIPIEQRDATELTTLGGMRTAAEGVGAWNPVFDVTPAALIDVLVTERGVVERPDAARLLALFGH